MNSETKQGVRNQKGETPMIPQYLLSNNGCEKNLDVCYGCESSTKQNPLTGRWFITMGHPNFNSTANNGRGYITQAAAVRAVEKAGGK